jgi:hypothetical protein
VTRALLELCPLCGKGTEECKALDFNYDSWKSFHTWLSQDYMGKIKESRAPSFIVTSKSPMNNCSLPGTILGTGEYAQRNLTKFLSLRGAYSKANA